MTSPRWARWDGRERRGPDWERKPRASGAIFEQPDEATARDQCGRVIAMLESRLPSVAALIAEAEPDLLAHFTFPEA